MTKRRPTVMDADVRAAIRTLDTAPILIGARAWPDAASSFNAPGLYAWCVDALGAAGGLCQRTRQGGRDGPDLRWPGGRDEVAVWASRASNAPEQNYVSAPGRKHPGVDVSAHARLRAGRRAEFAADRSQDIGLDGESRLSQWIRDHPAVALYAFEKRDVLADLEHRVLVELNPPLNLEGRPPSDIRTSLTRLRTRIPGT